MGNRIVDFLKKAAEEEGIELFGVVPPEPSDMKEIFMKWLALGYHGDMKYMERKERLDPRKIMENVKSIAVFGLNYYKKLDFSDAPCQGIISLYAVRRDYHRVFEKKLKRIVRKLKAHQKRDFSYKIYVDYGPIFEKELGVWAGFGFIGKNSMLINDKLGTFFFLGEILLDLEIEKTKFNPPLRCGSCTRCIDACPTGAIVEERLIDSRRCISYLTIEKKGVIEKELREKIGNFVFGCDLCQIVCPYNSKKLQEKEDEDFPVLLERSYPLEELYFKEEESFKNFFKGTPILRTKREGLARNVAIAIGNSRNKKFKSILLRMLKDVSPIVRAHVVWAISKVQFDGWREILIEKRKTEKSPIVIREIDLALKYP